MTDATLLHIDALIFKGDATTSKSNAMDAHPHYKLITSLMT